MPSAAALPARSDPFCRSRQAARLSSQPVYGRHFRDYQRSSLASEMADINLAAEHEQSVNA